MSYLSFEQPRHFYKKESSQIFLLFHFKYAKLALLVKYVATRILSACLDKDIGFVTTYLLIYIYYGVFYQTDKILSGLVQLSYILWHQMGLMVRVIFSIQTQHIVRTDGRKSKCQAT